MNATPLTLDDGRVLQAAGRPGYYYLKDGTTVRAEIDGDRVRLFEPGPGGAELEGGRIAVVPPARSRPKQARQPGSGAAADRFVTFNTFVDTVARHLSAVEIVVWTIMYRDCRNGTATTSNRDIVRRSGCSLRSVTAAVQRLRQVGLVTAIRLSKHKGLPSQYAINARPDICVTKLVDMARERTGARRAPVQEIGQSGTGAPRAPVRKTNRCKKRHEPVQPLHHSHKAEGQRSVCLPADGPVPAETKTPTGHPAAAPRRPATGRTKVRPTNDTLASKEPHTDPRIAATATTQAGTPPHA